MTASVIGALRVSLGLDSAQFQRGARQASGAMQNMRRNIMAVSAAMGVVGVAAFALVRDVANVGVEISRQSAIANTSTRDFQRLAAAAATVGIEQDKLADILKDVNDRVGDFLTTGGGPMADFFENIAPQVGVTADNFRDLSGADALQLFVSSLEKANLSQAEMTFYMEAMASDATALIPLLRNNGTEIERLGDAAEATGAIMSDEAVANSNDFRAAMGRLSLGVTGLRNTIAENLMPIFTDLINRIADHVIPAIDSMIVTVTGWIEAFRELPGPVQEAVGIVAVALGAGGPLMLAIGVVSVAIRTLVGAAGPIGLFITAASLLAAAWVAWGDDIKAAIGPAIAWISEKFDWLLGKIQNVVDVAIRAKTALQEVFSLGEFASGPQLMAPDVAASGRAEGNAIGAAIAAGVVEGATNSGAVDELRDYINSFPEAARDELQVRSPSRVFAEIGRYISEGLGLGIRQGEQAATDAMSDVVGGIADQTDDAAIALSSLEQTARSAFSGFVSGSMSASAAAASLLDSLSNILLDQAFNALFAPFFSSGGPLAAMIPGFAGGTSYAPGGLAMVGERGPELVNLPRGSQVYSAGNTARMMQDGGGSGGSMRIVIEENPMFASRVTSIAGGVAVEVTKENSRQMAQAQRRY